MTLGIQQLARGDYEGREDSDYHDNPDDAEELFTSIRIHKVSLMGKLFGYNYFF